MRDKVIKIRIISDFHDVSLCTGKTWIQTHLSSGNGICYFLFDYPTHEPNFLYVSIHPILQHIHTHTHTQTLILEGRQNLSPTIDMKNSRLAFPRKCVARVQAHGLYSASQMYLPHIRRPQAILPGGSRSCRNVKFLR